jgi:hypothetical protein
MRKYIYAVFLIGILMVMIPSCSTPQRRLDISEKKRGTLNEEERFYLDNINTTELLIEHIGEQDTFIPSTLFQCFNDVDYKSGKVVDIHYSEENWDRIISGYNEFKKILDFVFSKSNKSLDVNPKNDHKIGTYRFSIYNQNKKITFIFDNKTYDEIIRKISVILKNNQEVVEYLKNLLWES